MIANLESLFGGIAYDYGKRHEPHLVAWPLFFMTGSATAVLMWINPRRFTLVRDRRSSIFCWVFAS